jgi:2'-5' RNA ligase
MKRLFVAIDISDEARRAAAEHVRLLRDQFDTPIVKWERSEKLHLTLCFLGPTADDLLPRINDRLNEAAANHLRFQISLAGSGVFGSPRAPRVLWLGIGKGDFQLSSLAKSIGEQMANVGFKLEKRKFAAHLTIARIKEPQRAAALADLHLTMKFKPVEFEVSELALYESQLRPTGSIYSKLRAFPLGNTGQR